MEFEGEFETHITVRVPDADGVEALRARADRRRLRFHHILLDRGQTPSQPMISQRGRGRLSEQLAAAEELARGLTADGFRVVRIKIEAAPSNRDVPVTDADADRHPGRYFEHHVKLELEPAADIPALTRLAQEHSAHLSRNARRARMDGCQERFVTQRCHAVGRSTAAARLTALRDALTKGGYVILSVEDEFVVHDSEPGVDAGWLVPGGGP